MVKLKGEVVGWSLFDAFEEAFQDGFEDTFQDTCEDACEEPCEEPCEDAFQDASKIFLKSPFEIPLKMIAMLSLKIIPQS